MMWYKLRFRMKKLGVDFFEYEALLPYEREVELSMHIQDADKEAQQRAQR